MSRIVVGVDESFTAREALRWALREAELRELPVSVVTVVDPLLVAANPTGRSDEFVESAQADAQAMVEEVVAKEGSAYGDVDVVVHAVVGHPVRKLVTAAHGAEMLVVGSRGAGLFSQVLLGSTSSGVAHHAPCTVVIVRG